MVKDLKESNPNQWYSKLKRMCRYDQYKLEPIQIDEISEHTIQFDTKISQFYVV